MTATFTAIFDQALPEPDGAGAPAWAHLLPLGWIVGRDGRTLMLGNPDAVVAAFAAGAIGLPVDYEHQSDKPEPGRVGPIPAAGWIKELAVRADGLWGRIAWTARARDLIAEGVPLPQPRGPAPQGRDGGAPQGRLAGLQPQPLPHRACVPGEPHARARLPPGASRLRWGSHPRPERTPSLLPWRS